MILRASARLNGLTEIALTKLDVLRGLEKLKICTAYKYQGQEISYPPQGEGTLGEVTPCYEELPGFDEDISGIRTFNALPANVRRYVERVEELVGVHIAYISVGCDRDATIVR